MNAQNTKEEKNDILSRLKQHENEELRELLKDINNNWIKEFGIF